MFKKVSFVFSLAAFLAAFPALTQAQTKQLMIPAYAFHPMDYDAQFVMGNGELYALGTSPSGLFAAPVYLPQGARITKIEVRARNNGGENFSVVLWRRNMYANILQNMAAVLVTNTGGAWQSFTDSTIVHWTVNNSGYGYYIVITFGDALGPDYQIEGVKIDYLESLLSKII